MSTYYYVRDKLTWWLMNRVYKSSSGCIFFFLFSPLFSSLPSISIPFLNHYLYFSFTAFVLRIMQVMDVSSIAEKNQGDTLKFWWKNNLICKLVKILPNLSCFCTSLLFLVICDVSIFCRSVYWTSQSMKCWTKH